MRMRDVDGVKLSGLCLGGGKFAGIGRQMGYELIDKALGMGVNVFDSHHRYGISEDILGTYADNLPTIKVMTKISAYNKDWRNTIVNSVITLNRKPNIYWVSDLDDDGLYTAGNTIYKNMLLDKGLRVGITTESAVHGLRFLKEHPECKFYMVPYFPGKGSYMKDFCNAVKAEGKYLFIIKPFNDGISFGSNISDRNKIIKASLEFIINNVNPDVICFGSKNIDHIEETINIYNEICEGGGVDVTA